MLEVHRLPFVHTLFDLQRNVSPPSIDTTGLYVSELKSLLWKMVFIRKAEEKIAKGKKDGAIGGPVHLGVGQEAVPVGISAALLECDVAFGAHRSHGHLLARNMDSYPLFAEVLGKSTGYSKGMGGSMHLWDGSSGFLGSVPIVAGTVSLAVGAALAQKIKGERSVAIAYLGDGAVEEGVVHECLNFSSLHKLPIIFVIENNLFASHMHISERQPKPSVCRFAEANNINHAVVDGNDVVGVLNASRPLIANARKSNGPALLEAVTYRWYGHVDWREDIDVGVSRSAQDIANWKRLDPIKRLKDALIKKDALSEESYSQMDKKVATEIEEAWSSAVSDDPPKPTELLKNVYYGAVST